MEERKRGTRQQVVDWPLRRSGQGGAKGRVCVADLMCETSESNAFKRFLPSHTPHAHKKCIHPHRKIYLLPLVKGGALTFMSDVLLVPMQ